MEQDLSAITFLFSVLTIGFFTYFAIVISKIIVSFMIRMKIRTKLKKYDLHYYEIVATFKGTPCTLQKIDERNEIIYL